MSNQNETSNAVKREAGLDMGRRELLKLTGAGVVTLGVTSIFNTSNARAQNMAQNWDKTFPKSEKIDHQKVTFKNRYGITLSGDLYLPKERGDRRLPALVVAGPFGAVKEQSSGLYAQTMAERGFVTVAFDPSYTGESSGEPRNVASPDIFTEDYSAAVDFLGQQENVARDRIGAVGICGLSGMALTAATSDSRVKAVATFSMYDMSRSMTADYEGGYTPEQRRKVVDYLSQQRWADVDSGSFARGYHEVPFDADGNIVRGDRVLPESLPANPHPVLAAFFDYYKTPRGFHPRGINSAAAWTATTPMSFFNFPLYSNVGLISPRPVLLVAGENAHSRFYSEDVYKAASDPRELLIVPNADHVDLYDQMDKIPFEKLASFFNQHLSA